VQKADGAAVRFFWCALADDDRHFLYSPRFGAAYLLDREQVGNEVLLWLLGLPPSMRVAAVEDPAVRVGLAGAHEKELSPSDLAGWVKSEPQAHLRRLGRWYRLFHRYRHVFTPLTIERWARVLSLSFDSAARSQNWTLERIAKLVAATEHQAGFSDCFPRALLTAGLCVIAGIRFNITIGILAPTRKLHAWCTSDGTLIYEPTPRHWWYRPLVDFRSRATDGS
jgi:hypothetical protein